MSNSLHTEQISDHSFLARPENLKKLVRIQIWARQRKDPIFTRCVIRRDD